MSNDKKHWQEPKVSSIDDLASAFGATCSKGGSASGCSPVGNGYTASPQGCTTGSSAAAKCSCGNTAAQQCCTGSNLNL